MVIVAVAVRITMMVEEVILLAGAMIRMVREEAGRNDRDGEIEVVEDPRSGG